ncbi:MAG: DUF2177 family protein [Candidatus Woesearchaeota archaeon]
MKNRLKKTALTTLILLPVDIMWIYFAALPLYRLANLEITLLTFPALLAYMCIMLGIIASQDTTLKKTLLRSSVIGFSAYGIYAFTNTAIFMYPLWLAVTDAVWGGVLFSLGGYIFFKIP